MDRKENINFMFYATAGWEEPTSKNQKAGSIATLACQKPVIPTVTFPTPQPPFSSLLRIARPRFCAPHVRSTCLC